MTPPLVLVLDICQEVGWRGTQASYRRGAQLCLSVSMHLIPVIGMLFRRPL